MDVLGYGDRPSVAPGETIRFMVSCAHPRYEAQVVRLVHGDEDPAGPGYRAEEVATPIDGEHPGRVQELRRGSSVVVPNAAALRLERSLTIQAWIFPTTPGAGVQGIVTGSGYGLVLDERGCLALELGDAARVTTSVPLVAREWSFVVGAFDAGSRTARLVQRPLRSALLGLGSAAVEAPVAGGRLGDSEAPLVLGDRFNGKIDSPRLWRTALPDSALEALYAGANPLEIDGSALVAAWDFSLDISSSRVSDVSGNGLHGTAVNVPTRAVTGRNWRGDEVDFRRAPEQYAAIHFHDDDLADAGWEPDLELTVPDDFRSGVYAVRVRAGESEDHIPFFVRPPRGRATAEIAFLAPTLSYLAYANEHSSWGDPVSAYAGFGSSRDGMQPQDRAILEHGLHSIYDVHSDGTGVCYASWRRPLLSMRPKYDMPLIRAPHQLNGDLHLVDWLETKGFRYDVVTDHDLHADGVALLERYRVILTGNHPEYWTGAMLDALERYLAGGGRLMYLGGNGFWWVTSIHPEHPDALEVRRGRSGISPWVSAPGETHHAGTGEPGGQWTFRGRPPEALVGVGFSGQGSDAALPYRRLEASRDPRAAFIFEGIGADEPIGSGGLVLGGAGGAEVDDADPGLGTPPHALRVATVDGFSDTYLAERLGPAYGRPDFTPPASSDVRGDIVYFETPNGGAVFSTGSIAWCGSLSDGGYAGPVSRITENVLRRFVA